MKIFAKTRNGPHRTISFLGLFHVRYTKKGCPMHAKTSLGTRPIQDGQDGSDVIFNLLRDGRPCLVSRFGTTEMELVDDYVRGHFSTWKAFPKKLTCRMQNFSGFFPLQRDLLARFSQESLAIFPNIDVLGLRIKPYDYGFWEKEDFFASRYCPNAALIHLHQIAPYDVRSPWMRYLEGKKVLVIHPFADTIRRQYAKRTLLFQDADAFLPEFELKIVKAVQSLGAASNVSFATWFDALAYMCRQIDKEDFDIALIGAGAYGMFLGDYVKRKGKQAIHVGGALQLFFGIRGQRWDSSDTISALYNEHWTSPSDAEKFPAQGNGDDGRQYW